MKQKVDKKQLLAAHRGADPLIPEAFQEWRAGQHKIK